MQNIGVCNPGGGALCSAQAGALKALFEWLVIRGLKPRAVRGASGGDLNSPIFVQAFADEGESITTMEEMWKTVSHRKVHTMIPHIYPRSTGLFKLTPLRRELERTLSPEKILSTGIDYSVKATRYGLGPDVEVRAGDPEFIDMIIASASYPGMFKPIKIWNGWFSDMGVNNNVPINRLIRAGCTTIFIVRPYPRVTHDQLRRKDLRIFKLVWRILGELMHNQLDMQIEQVHYVNELVAAGVLSDKKKIRLIELAPQSEPDLGVMEFNARKCSVAFDDGYRNAKKILSSTKF